MTEQPRPAPAPTRRRYGGLPFLLVFLGGFALIAIRSLMGPEGFAMETVGPLIGGGIMALFVAWIVARERGDRTDSGHEPKPPL